MKLKINLFSLHFFSENFDELATEILKLDINSPSLSKKIEKLKEKIKQGDFH